jgi:hypothetical protein
VARQQRVTQFIALAQCEIWSRVKAFQVAIATNPSNQPGTAKLHAVVSKCVSDASDEGHSKDSESAGEAYFKTHCPSRFYLFFQELVDQLIPGRFKKQDEASNQNVGTTFTNIGVPVGKKKNI